MPNCIAILRQEPPNGALNAGGGSRNRDFEPISGFSAYCQRYAILELHARNDDGGLALQQARCCQQGRRWTTATVSQVMTHRW